MARVGMTWPMMQRSECVIGRRLQLLQPQQTATLAALLIAGPLGLDVGQLIEIVWPDPDAQPLTAKGIVGQYVHELRAFGVKIELGVGSRVLIPAEARTARDRSLWCADPDNCQGGSRRSRPLCRRCDNLRQADIRLRFGLTRRQAEMWILIRRRPGMTFGQIKQSMPGGPTMLKKRLDALIAKGLVRRERVRSGLRGWHYALFVRDWGYRLMAPPDRHLPALVDEALRRGVSWERRKCRPERRLVDCPAPG